MNADFPDVLREHATSMWSEGFYTVAIALDKAADQLDARAAGEQREAVSLPA